MKMSVDCLMQFWQIKALREDELNENFFQALSHVQEIHSNCKLLLRTHHQVRFAIFSLWFVNCVYFVVQSGLLWLVLNVWGLYAACGFGIDGYDGCVSRRSI